MLVSLLFDESYIRKIPDIFGKCLDIRIADSKWAFEWPYGLGLIYICKFKESFRLILGSRVYLH